MKKKAIILWKWLFFGCGIFLCHCVCAQQDWPKTLTAGDGAIIKIYQPQPDSFSGNILKSRSAVSVLEKDSSDPVFGTLWSTARVESDREDRILMVRSVTVNALKIPGDSAQARIDYFKAMLEAELPEAAGSISLDMVLTSLQQDLDERKLSKDINTQVPAIIYASSSSVLVTIDGAPRLQLNKDWGLDAVVNSPFTIVQDKDKVFYLYGGGHWYSAASATGPYAPVPGKVSSRLRRIEKAYDKENPDRSNDDAGTAATASSVPAVIVSTTPAELVQTNGNPAFLPIEGGNLLYVANSPNDLFLDTQSQLYYLLLSGRWYFNKSISSGQWSYISADRLPADFARIPEGSPKDNVLASVAGTDAAREALMDAQIPQTAKVDRKTATTHVSYDGPAEFQAIPGTDLQYAINTSSTVLLYNGSYYSVDNGIWFVSATAVGPWSPSETRPADVDRIPPSSPVYNTKFVDIYDITPDYIYTGYTPGYLNNFIYGPTVVFGTGFYYDPWIGNYYYPRPWSWGFNVVYNPWYGWGFGAGFGFDWFNIGFGIGGGGWFGGWWGPGFYHPSCWGFGGGYRPRSFYGRNLAMDGHTGIHSRDNIYRNRPGITAGHRDGFSPWRNAGPADRDRAVSRSASNTMSDRRGNVFQRGENGAWQSRSAGGAAPDRPGALPSDLNREQQMRDRGQVRMQNFQRAQDFSLRSFGPRAGAGFPGRGVNGRR